MESNEYHSRIDESILSNSNPLQNIKNIEQSMQILKGKLSQMNRKQSQNVKQIQKVFYSSIPILKNKMNQTFEFEKFQERKKLKFNEEIFRQRQQINKQRKMINEKQVQRNRQLINIIKINQHKTIRQMSKKNELLIQKMRNQRLEQNKRKKQLIKDKIQNSRMKVQDFHSLKKQELKKQKQQQALSLQKKAIKMLGQLGTLNNKQNQTISRVDKTSEALRQLKFAVKRLEKMNEQQFIKLRMHVGENQAFTDDQELMQKILGNLIENQPIAPSKYSRTIFNSKLSNLNKSEIA